MEKNLGTFYLSYPDAQDVVVILGQFPEPPMMLYGITQWPTNVYFNSIIS
jgi:hypothetical protein